MEWYLSNEGVATGRTVLEMTTGEAAMGVTTAANKMKVTVVLDSVASLPGVSWDYFHAGVAETYKYPKELVREQK